jgi:hypothetical protein
MVDLPYMNKDIIKQAIIETLAYFDVFDTPLTSEEIHRWLWKCEATYLDVQESLSAMYKDVRIGKKDGFYFLLGMDEIVAKRQLSIPIIDKKMDIAKKAAKKLRYIPFFRAMFVCNTVASSSASHCSDIDVFIVVRKGRLWLTRLFITLTLSLFRLRRTKKHVANKICLSFYVTDEHLDLSDVSIDEPDIYQMYWIDQLIPIYDPENVREEILKKNKNAHSYIPNAFQPFNMHPRWRVNRKKISYSVRRIFEKVWEKGYGDMIEKQAKGAQEKKMAMNYKSVREESNTNVVIDNTMLKFHENDRRAAFREEWRKRVTNFKNNVISTGASTE